MCLLLRSIRRMKVLMLALLGLLSVAPAIAYQSGGDATRWTPVSEAVLDGMRGGFQRDPDGPFMSFGIERNVFLNEKLVNSTVLNIPDMKRFADHPGMRPFADHHDMKPFADHPSDTFTLIQTGPGNSLTPDLSSLPPFMTVIQNSLDNRTIQSETIINATVEALSWARSLALGDALSQTTIDTIRH